MSDGNLKITSSGNYGNITASIGVSSGKWYYEYTTQTSIVCLGITRDIEPESAPGNYESSYAFNVAGGTAYKQTDGTSATYGSVPGGGDVIGVAFDLDNGSIEIYINGVSQGVMFNTSKLSSGDTFFAQVGDGTQTGNIDGIAVSYTHLTLPTTD